MAKVIVTLTIMPENPEIDLNAVKTKATEIIATNYGEVGKEEIEPIAFGLNALKLTYIVDESRGGTGTVEQSVATIEGVQSAEVTDVRRALG